MQPSDYAILNRTEQATFLALLEREIDAQAKAASGLCLVLVQIWNVNELNLSFGYQGVDAELAALASRLRQGFGKHGACMRIGTKRFALLLRDVRAESHALLAANKVERLLREVAAHEADGPIKLEAMQGIALCPAHATSAEALFRAAEIALLVARESSGIAIHSPAAATKFGQLRRVEAGLRYALENGGIETYFQPQINLATGAVHGAEALLRCRDQDGTFLPPEAVIQVAERTRLLDDVTAAVFSTALRYAAEWPDGRHNLSVNVSTKNLKDRNLSESILSLLKIWGRKPESLTVEITEGAFMEEPQTSFVTMRALRAAGMRVAIDDFGTGYSSLSYFKDIPANELKIDKSFVFNMRESDADRRIVKATIDLAHAFDLHVVAEGVEDLASAQKLRALGCNLAQGYWIGKPMAPAAYLEWLRQTREPKDLVASLAMPTV